MSQQQVDPAKLKSIFDRFDSRLKAGESHTTLMREFQTLLSEEQKLWADPKNFKTGNALARLNRYSNIIPLESTLFPVESKSDPKVYFNANFLNAAGNPSFGKFPFNFVAHQAPIPDNIPAFWRAVNKTKAFGIVMVTGLVEGGRQKADPYWPQKEGDSLKIDSFGLVVKNCGELDKEASQAAGMSKTSISITAAPSNDNNGTETEFKTILYRYNQWPDHGVPKDAQSYRYLVDRLQERIQEQHQKENNNSTTSTNLQSPLFVHCSAGIGRTGTLIGTLIGNHMFKNGVFDADKTPFEIVRWLKHQRVGSVQQGEQYLFMHKVLHSQMEAFLRGSQ